MGGGDEEQPPSITSAQASIEVLLIFIFFFVLAGGAAPDVNEAHYLGKAKHYWNPGWCAGDFFLQSADAHVVFYWTIGWLTKFVSLDATAWIGRCVTWLLLAWSWQRLSSAVVPRAMWSLLTVALFAMLLRCGHMAGEWIIGGVEAKGFAYVFVFLGLEALVRDRWRAVWILFGAASAFHVLVGGWSVVAGVIAWGLARKQRPSLKSMLPALMLGGVLSLPGLLPGVLLASGVDAATAREANEVYAWRLAHHLTFSHVLAQKITLDFAYLGGEPMDVGATHLYFVRHLVLLIAAVALFRFAKPDPASTRLYSFVGGAMLIALAGIAIDQLTIDHPDLSAKLLRYYWFRLSDAMLPLGASFLAIQAILRLQETRPAVASAAFVAVMLLVVENVGDIFLRRRHDPRPASIVQSTGGGADERMRKYQEWLNVCLWIKEHTSENEIFLTPRYQQTFKWYAHRAEVVCFKDIPQDATGLVAWKDRFADVYPTRVRTFGLSAHDRDELLRLSRKYGFRYILIDRNRSRDSLPFVRVYPQRWQHSSTYEVYELPPPPVTAIAGEEADDGY